MRHPLGGPIVLPRMPCSAIVRATLLHTCLLAGLSAIGPDAVLASFSTPIGTSDSSGHSFGPSPRRLGTSRVRRSKNTYGSHYFLSFSAIPLKKNNGFYKNTMVSLNTVAYGLTEHFSAAASLDLVSLIRAREGGPVFTGRLQLGGSLSEVVHIGVSATYLNTRVPVGAEVPVGTEVPPGFLAGMAMLTIGSINNQVTLSGGWTHDGTSASRGPLLNVAGAARIFPNFMLVTEHWIFSDPDRSFMANSFGVRILGDDLAIDVGFAYDEEYTNKITPIGLPFLSATLNF